MFFIVVLYIIFGIYVLKTLYNHLKKYGWSVFSYSTIFIFLFYILAPIVILLFVNNNNKDLYAYNLPILYSNISLLLVFLVIFIGIISFFKGYESNKNSSFYITERKLYKTNITVFMIWFILALSVIGFLLYIKGFGSFANAVNNANLVRSGYYKELEDGDTSHTFFFRFIFLSMIPFLYSFYKGYRYSLSNKAMMMVSSTILLTTYFFLSPGRQSIIDFVLIFVLVDLINKRKVINLKIVTVGVLAFLILPTLETFFRSSEFSLIKAKTSFTTLFVNEFGFPYLSLIYSIHEDFNFYLFSDFFSNIFGKILPTSWNPGIESSNYLNTYFMYGYRDRSVPPGLLAQGYYSLSIIGVFLISFFTGRFFSFLDNFFRSLIEYNKRAVFFYVYFILGSMVWIRTGLPGNYFYSFTFIMFIIFISVSFKKK